MDDNISRQPDAKKRGRPEGGIRKAARDLGLPEVEVRRALKVASLSPEAQDKARKTGLDNNRSALLAAAKEVTVEGQVAVLDSWGKTHKKEEQVKEWNRLVDAWNDASTETQVKFLRAISSMSKSE